MCVRVIAEVRRGITTLAAGVRGGCVSHLVWVLGIELGSPGRTTGVFNHWATSPVPLQFLFILCVHVFCLHECLDIVYKAGAPRSSFLSRASPEAMMVPSQHSRTRELLMFVVTIVLYLR